MKATGLQYFSGHGSHISSEALPDALPKGQNSPQLCPYGLYAEQLSGSAFTAPRHKNLRSWLYRIRPSVCHNAGNPTVPSDEQKVLDEFEGLRTEPQQLRWNPPLRPSAGEAVDFLGGLKLVCGAGDPSLKDGLGVYTYAMNTSMSAVRDRYVLAWCGMQCSAVQCSAARCSAG
jgi:homogentisate 1,2-dioxygenase